jgi:predicted flavoprotein YhiN
VVEAKPSAGRKFLMAGKSGLNITKDEPPEAFRAAYGSAEDWLSPMLDAFGPREAMDWAEGLGQSVFTGSSGAGVSRGDEGLAAAAGMAQADRGGVAAGLAVGRLGRRRLGVRDGFGARVLRPGVTVLALGGASWRRLGSDGEWAAAIGGKGRGPGPVPACQHGVRVDWTPHMAPIWASR